MKTITIGKFRGIQNCTSQDGILTCLAMDHRQNLKKSLHPDNPTATTNTELRDFKLQVCRTLSSDCTAILLDPEYSASQVIATRSLAKGTGLVVAIEATGYVGMPDQRGTRLLKNWNVKKVKLMGADAVKLLVYYHPASPNSGEIEELVKQTANACDQYDIPFMIEPLSYSLKENQEPLSSAEKEEVIIETARKLTPLGPDILKVEFPLEKTDSDRNRWADAFLSISKASCTPWILLSAGVSFQTYQDWVEVACENGASGVAVGRAVWKEAVNLQGNERLRFLETTARSRLKKLRQICQEKGKSVFDFFEAQAPFPWYKQYNPDNL